MEWMHAGSGVQLRFFNNALEESGEQSEHGLQISTRCEHDERSWPVIRQDIRHLCRIRAIGPCRQSVRRSLPLSWHSCFKPHLCCSDPSSPRTQNSEIRMAAAATLPLLLLLLLAALPAPSHAWGVDGHLMVCQIAQGRLSSAAAAAVKDLLPSYAGNNLSSLCSWADDVKFRYRWSSPLHYIDTPDGLCTYSYDRDCKDEDGVKGRCVAGAINNYTSQLLTYGKSSSPEYNLTQALLFLSHFIGDIHQPLHVGFSSDKGGNTIDVHWYTRKTVLHHVWDASIIQTAEDDFYGGSVAGYIDTLKKNITQGEWSEQVSSWEACGKNQTACPDIYASESITAACDWAYKGVEEDSTLEDPYFSSRLPIVNLRLAQGGVRLAATLNRIFG